MVRRSRTGSKPIVIPKLCLHKATGQAVVRLSGEDVYCGKFGTPAAEERYDREVLEWLERGRQRRRKVVGAPPPPSPASPSPFDPSGPPISLTVNELLLRYWRFAEQYYTTSKKALETIRLALRALRRLYGPILAAAFGPVALKTVRQRMLDTQTRTVAIRDEDGNKVGDRIVEYLLSRRTINQRIGIIKRVFAWGVEEELVPPGVHHGLSAVRNLKKKRSTAKEPRKVRPVPDADVDAVLPHVPGPVRAMAKLQRLTGARSGEIVIMRACDIDRTSDIWVYRPYKHKSEHRDDEQVREIVLGPRAQAILEPYLNGSPTAYLFSPRRAMEERYRQLREARKTKVQPSQMCRKKPNPRKQPGDRYTSHSYRRAILAACRKAGLEPWHPHQLRHLAATKLRQQYGIEVARVILGHSTLGATSIYAEADHARAVEIMARIG
jgi:integrase